MKKVLFFIVLLVAVTLGALADTIMVRDTVFVNPHTINANDIPIGGTWQEWISFVVGALLLLWEIVLRVIPTSKDWTIAGKIVTILDWIAGLFNKGVGNAAKTDAGKGKFSKTKVTL